MSLTLDRLQSNITRELSILLQREARDSKIGYVTITEVRMTNDLSFATVYFTIMGDEKRINTCLDALNKAKGYLRSELAKRVKARKMPQLIFKYDEALAYGNHISEILGSLNIKKEDK